MHGTVASTFLDIYEKFTNFCQVPREMHTKEKWFLFLPHGVNSNGKRVRFVAAAFYCISVKKLNSLKHLVRTTVAGSHN